MDEGGRFARFLRARARSAGRRYEEARQAYRAARDERLAGEVPTDGDGQAQIVCRRYAERRAVPLDERQRPACYEADHPDCEGCWQDVRTGHIETW